jgi:hypothetical protein
MIMPSTVTATGHMSLYVTTTLEKKKRKTGEKGENGRKKRRCENMYTSRPSDD